MINILSKMLANTGVSKRQVLVFHEWITENCNDFEQEEIEIYLIGIPYTYENVDEFIADNRYTFMDVCGMPMPVLNDLKKTKL